MSSKVLAITMPPFVWLLVSSNCKTMMSIHDATTIVARGKSLYTLGFHADFGGLICELCRQNRLETRKFEVFLSESLEDECAEEDEVTAILATNANLNPAQT